MRGAHLRRKSLLLLSLLLPGLPWTAGLQADPVKVRFPQGTSHGFLVLRDSEGKTIAVGDTTQTVRGGRVSTRLLFRFRDGSVDDETAVYTQKGVFRLLRDHHLQRGPSFPKPFEMSIDVPAGIVVMREPQKGKPDKVETKHMDLPPDLCNGLSFTLMLNIPQDAPKTVLPYLASYSGARLIHLSVTPGGTLPFRVSGGTRPAREFVVHIELGGATGVVAPMLGKQPKDVQFLLLEDNPPAFVREEGQLYQDGPVWRIDQVGPVTH